MQETLKHYRYVDDVMEEGEVLLHLVEFQVLKETPKGYWVIENGLNFPGSVDRHKRWVSKDSTKRFCYPSKSEALSSFFRRKVRQVAILGHRLHFAEKALATAQRLLKEKKLPAERRYYLD